MSRILHTLRLGLIACLLLGLLPLPALATEDWYASIKGGVNSGPSAEERFQDLLGSADYKLGLALLGAVGYHVTDEIRIEAEISWRRNTVDTEQLSGSVSGIPVSGSIKGEGSLSNLAAMVNAAYEWNITPRFRPFVLAGIGMSRVTAELDNIETIQLDNIGTIPVNVDFDLDETKYTFAYQGGVGIGYSLTETVTVDVSYRFFGTPSVDFSRNAVKSEVNNINHTGLFGLTYAF